MAFVLTLSILQCYKAQGTVSEINSNNLTGGTNWVMLTQRFSILVFTLQGTYVRLEQTSEAIRETQNVQSLRNWTGIENRCGNQNNLDAGVLVITHSSHIYIIFSHRAWYSFGKLFSLNKWNHHLKTEFCIYLHYLCELFQFVWLYESFKCDKYATNTRQKKKMMKNNNNRKGAEHFSWHCI